MNDASEDEQILDRLREWLRETRLQAEQLGSAEGAQSAPAESPERDFGLYRLVEEFTALRQDLKLQTRSARGLEEQTETLLAALRQALEAFRSIEPKEAQASWSAGKALASALADLDEALDRGRTQIERACQRLIEEPTAAFLVQLDAHFSGQSWLRRRMLKAYYHQVRELIVQQEPRERQILMQALLEGYGLIQDRLGRALSAERISRIGTVGRAVDPEQMIVVEVVDVPGSKSGIVLEEVRRGYTWDGRVLRYAEVRATRWQPDISF